MWQTVQFVVFEKPIFSKYITVLCPTSYNILLTCLQELVKIFIYFLVTFWKSYLSSDDLWLALGIIISLSGCKISLINLDFLKRRKSEYAQDYELGAKRFFPLFILTCIKLEMFLLVINWPTCNKSNIPYLKLIFNW